MPSQLPQFWKINKADWSKFTELCENTLNSAGYLASTLEFGPCLQAGLQSQCLSNGTVNVM